jgi:hypothetical protein
VPSFAALFAVATLSGAGARADAAAAIAGGWRVISEQHGITQEKRPVPGSRYFDYRVRAHTTVAAPLAAQRIWDGIAGEHPPSIKKRTVVRRSADELIVYDQIHTPVVTDRDVTVRLRKRAVGAGFVIRFDTANELGPPPSSDYVRLPVVRGAWRVEPDPKGGAFVSYDCYSEPGGSIPAFLVRGAQQDQVLAEFEQVLARIGR